MGKGANLKSTGGSNKLSSWIKRVSSSGFAKVYSPSSNYDQLFSGVCGELFYLRDCELGISLS